MISSLVRNSQPLSADNKPVDQVKKDHIILEHATYAHLEGCKSLHQKLNK